MQIRDLAFGALAGLAGTFVVQGLLMSTQRWAPSAMPPVREDPGDFMVEQAEQVLPESVRRRIPGPAEFAASRALAIGYGMTFGVLYAGLRPSRGSRLLYGVGLGLLTWGAGYLGWLWLMGLTPPPSQQRPMQLLTPALQHVGYGLATVGAHEWLKQRLA